MTSIHKVLTLLAGIGVSASGFTASGLSDNSKAWIELQLSRYPGATLMVATLSGDEVKYQAFGQLQGGPPAADTVYEIGSITKVFTHTLLAEMTAKQLVNYQSTLAELLPQTAFANPAIGQITLLQLATHTSGLPRLPANMQFENMDDPYAEYGPEKLLQALAEFPQDQTLEKGFAYSNMGVGLLGYLLGQVDGCGYSAALHKHVLTPAGMQDTAVDDIEAHAARLAPGRAGTQEVSAWHFTSLAGAGALRSTAGDLVKFIRLYVQPGESPYQRPLSANLEQAVRVNDNFQLTRVWFRSSGDNGQAYWHNGGTGGYRTFMGFDPASHSGIILLANHAAIDPTPVGLAELGAAPPLETGQKTANSKDYAGNFALTPQLILSVSEQDGQLLAQATGQSAVPLSPVAGEADRFKLVGVEAEIIFHRDEQQRVQSLTLNQGGQSLTAQRTEQQQPTEYTEIEIDTAILTDYTGRYALTPELQFHVKIEAERLLVKLTGQPYFPVYPHGPDQFFYKVVPATLTFSRENGKVVSLTLLQGGLEQVAKRIGD